MFASHRNRIALCGFMVACLALLTGCLPRANNPAAPIPTNLAAAAGDSAITLTWNASSGATGYNVKRATVSGGPYTLLGAPASPGYTDSVVTNGTTYYYVVSSLNANGESANSNEASATPTAASTAPQPPTNVIATPGDALITLTWSASTGAKNYVVQRSTTNGGPYSTLATPTGLSYTDASLVNGTTYYYVVAAANSAGQSANSAQVSGVPSGPPPTTFGTWTNVTPAGVDLTSALCSNYGVDTIQVDPVHPATLYTNFHCQGVWKSTDYGVTWTGPINQGSNQALVSDCSGGVTVAPSSTASVPTVYQACIRGSAIGFWRSTDAGVTWTRVNVLAAGSNQSYYPPVADPYDPSHLLMIGHEFDSTVESMDAGLTWTSVNLDSGMLQTNRSPAIFFIDTGNATTTRGTWLFIGDQTGGNTGTWRTSNSGANWVRVDKNEHVGNTQIYQPDKSGVVYMAGSFSVLGSGILRSADYGQTWAHEGDNTAESVVTGTNKNVYAMYGFPVGLSGSVNPSFQVGAQPGTGTYAMPGTPAALNLEGVAQIAVTNDGTHNILVGAMWNSGIWRYVEP